MEKRILALVFLGGLWAAAVGAQEAKRDTIKMEITATNPKDESQKLTIREPIPPGLTERKSIVVVPYVCCHYLDFRFSVVGITISWYGRYYWCIYVCTRLSSYRYRCMDGYNYGV